MKPIISIIVPVYNAVPFLDKCVQSILNQSFEDYFHNIVDMNVFVSEASLKSWQGFRSFNSKKYKVIYSGIEPLKCDRTNKQFKESEKVIFVTACRFSKEKGLERLINTFKSVNQINENWELWLIGDGYLRKELEGIVDSIDMRKKIKFIGFTKDLSRFYIHADFYINSSFIEALPVSILEAMSIGLPVLGSNVGGIPEVVINNYNGFLIDFENEKDAVSIINKAIDLTNEEYLKIATNAEKAFNDKFSLDSYVNKYLELIQ